MAAARAIPALRAQRSEARDRGLPRGVLPRPGRAALRLGPPRGDARAPGQGRVSVSDAPYSGTRRPGAPDARRRDGTAVAMAKHADRGRNGARIGGDRVRRRPTRALGAEAARGARSLRAVGPGAAGPLRVRPARALGARAL